MMNDDDGDDDNRHHHHHHHRRRCRHNHYNHHFSSSPSRGGGGGGVGRGGGRRRTTTRTRTRIRTRRRRTRNVHTLHIRNFITRILYSYLHYLKDKSKSFLSVVSLLRLLKIIGNSRLDSQLACTSNAKETGSQISERKPTFKSV